MISSHMPMHSLAVHRADTRDSTVPGRQIINALHLILGRRPNHIDQVLAHCRCDDSCCMVRCHVDRGGKIGIELVNVLFPVDNDPGGRNHIVTSWKRCRQNSDTML